MKYCTVKNCDVKHNAFGYCKSHYDRLRRLGDAETIPRGSKYHSKFCKLTDCNKKYYGRGYCVAHYTRLVRYNDASYTKICKDNRTRHPLYGTYRKMIERCYDQRCPQYKDYGGRGIFVSDSWLDKKEGFKNFVRSMGTKPSPQHSLDRINNEKGYEASNCKWSTKKEQANNRRPRSDATTAVYNGVRPYKSKNWGDAWVVRGTFNGSMQHIGIYKEIDEALSAKLFSENM